MENGKHRNIADALACNGPPRSTPSDTKCVCVEITHFKLKLKLTGAGGRVTVRLKFNDVDYEYYTSSPPCHKNNVDNDNYTHRATLMMVFAGCWVTIIVLPFTYQCSGAVGR